MNRKQIKTNNRTSRGAALVEFGAAFSVLVVFFVIPLANMSFVGVRFLIAQGAMQEFVHRIAMVERRSASYAALSNDHSWSNICSGSGADSTGGTLQLFVSDKNGAMASYQAGQKVPSKLLPNGSNAPCVYTYEMTSNFLIPPIYNGGGPHIPGLTAPIPVHLKARSTWENLSQDPATKEFYINE